MPKRILSPIPVFDIAALSAKLTEAGQRTSWIQKIYGHLIRHPHSTWHTAPSVPKAVLDVLDRHFVVSTSTVMETSTSSSGDSTKLLVQLQDGLQVESVILYYNPTGVDDAGVSVGHSRATLCISSQVGCQMACTFCATGTMGLKGDLSCGEIIEQLMHARRHTAIRNVVFMGMGEPLNNYEAVRNAVSLMCTQFFMRRSAITVSTVGIIPKIRQLARDLPGISLALSLHAPTQELRKELVPSARAYKLDKLMEAVQEYSHNPDNPNPKVFVEYVLLSGVNDREQEAHELGKLLQGKPMMVNLIPWNPVYSPGMPYKSPGPEAAAQFQTIVRSYGLPCTIRQEKGQDISGACGQLVIEAAARSAHIASSRAEGKDIEEILPRVATVSVR